MRARVLLRTLGGPAVAATLAGLVFLSASPLVSADKAKPVDGLKVFREEVRPLLVGKCLVCHGGERTRNGLDLKRRARVLTGGENGPALVPGSADKSLLYRKLAGHEMPPQNPLAEEQIAAFKRWIDAGAPYEDEPLVYVARRAGPDWWSLRPVRRPPVPRVTDPRAGANAVDAFLVRTLQEKGLRPAPEADRLTLIRRVTFDLTGLPPTPAEVDAFLADERPDAYERLVDCLLASPAYGERWARHWLDVVRFAESHGYETNALRMNAWPYRDYVIRAFNEDIPYPQFILEQLAGDTVSGADALVQSATGFLVGGAHDTVGNQTLEGQLQQRMDDLDDVVTTTGATFLGLTVNCARCHDHKFDPISQKDYYALQAVFAGVQHADREVHAPLRSAPEELARMRGELARLQRKLDHFELPARPDGKGPLRPPVNPCCNVERFDPVEVRFVRFTIRATHDGSEPCIDELEVYTSEETPRNLALAELGARATASSVYPNNPLHKLAHLNDGRHGNGRSWISAERGKGWVQIELPRTEKIERILWGRDREEKYRDRLAVDYVIEVGVDPGRWRVVASSADRRRYNPAAPPEPPLPPGLTPAQERLYTSLVKRRSRLLALLPEAASPMRVYAGTFAQPGPTHLLLRGDPLRKGDAVVPAGLSAAGPKLSVPADAPERRRRVALARWLGSADNPLTARVMVNRVWHYHFGQGLVVTPSDFGFNGDRPSHPELLDWLASEFMYGASGAIDSRRWSLKPLHRLLVTSATYRQSGRLDAKAMAVDWQNRLLWRMAPRRLEAEGVRDAILATSGRLDRRMGGPGYNLWEKNTNYVTVFKPKARLGPDEFRRMVYQFKPRSQQDPTFGVFDCPDAALARPRRTTSTTVLQALNLLNGRFLIDQAGYFAERLRDEAGDDPARQVERAFRLAFGRKPSEKELKAAVALARAHGTAALCRALYNANEFLYLD
ncbi:MAG: PSD1 domain-containing protein [Planctomycetes bacterium]|nr:PSD1 domain-containing protein [Planctomycetota bacterium]